MEQFKHNQESQPIELSIFFLTEMWERYGFYTIQTILIFYLSNKLALSDVKSYEIVGSFTALAYINSLFGGLVADKLIGSFKAIILGAIFLFVGYSILGIIDTMHGLICGLITIAIGTGLFKPNISSSLSTLYQENDTTRKDVGYTIYYVGIYVGALGGSLLGGYISHYCGWMATFYTAALGIAFGLITFIYGKKKFSLFSGQILKYQSYKNNLIAISFIFIIFIGSFFILNSELLSNICFTIVGIGCFIYILNIALMHNGMQRKKLLSFLLLMIMSIAYWAIFFQQFFSISLCTERITQIPFNIPASSVPSIESLGVIIFGPLINYVWLHYKRQNTPVSITTKFSLGFLFNSICFMLMIIGLLYSLQSNKQMNGWVIFLSYLIISIGELCLSPTSLSLVSVLVPKKFNSAMMGISLLSIGLGSKLAGFLANYAIVSNTQNATLRQMQNTYLYSFYNYFIISVITLVISIIIGKYIKSLIKN